MRPHDTAGSSVLFSSCPQTSPQALNVSGVTEECPTLDTVQVPSHSSPTSLSSRTCNIHCPVESRLLPFGVVPSCAAALLTSGSDILRPPSPQVGICLSVSTTPNILLPVLLSSSLPLPQPHLPVLLVRFPKCDPATRLAPPSSAAPGALSPRASEGCQESLEESPSSKGFRGASSLGGQISASLRILWTSASTSYMQQDTPVLPKRSSPTPNVFTLSSFPKFETAPLEFVPACIRTAHLALLSAYTSASSTRPHDPADV
ncbi:hypothetical protein DFH07DRAFT_957746 [Mycena maculata]|uniref:Uncharacterized protein n=1 Tax=Mycena maculata TaxID=230809 RepID=A0AAD7NGQ6_9AGAR|nr:hypothetical protein DFH07DRAFT_957746 [Mycena maculata]